MAVAADIIAWRGERRWQSKCMAAPPAQASRGWKINHSAAENVTNIDDGETQYLSPIASVIRKIKISIEIYLHWLKALLIKHIGEAFPYHDKNHQSTAITASKRKLSTLWPSINENKYRDARHYKMWRRMFDDDMQVCNRRAIKLSAPRDKWLLTMKINVSSAKASMYESGMINHVHDRENGEAYL